MNILKYGPSAYNQEHKFGEAVLGLFTQHKSHSVWGAVRGCFSSKMRTRIKNAYLVVTKRDLAVGGEESGNKLITLADALLGKELRGLMEGVGEENIVTCAAVRTVCTKRDESEHETTCAKTASDKPEAKYEQVSVPEAWPTSGEEWKKAKEDGRFWFEDTYPLFDERENVSPPQKGLDDLVKKLLELA